jgi:hypothetical protein
MGIFDEANVWDGPCPEDYLPLMPSNTKSNIPWNHEILVMGFHLNTIVLRF